MARRCCADPARGHRFVVGFAISLPDAGKNTRWQHPAFRGYADYMETDAFKKAAGELENLAEMSRCAVMCSEAVWWSCHRALLSDWLKIKGWQVMHIMTLEKEQEHPYTKAALVRGGILSYTDSEQLF